MPHDYEMISQKVYNIFLIIISIGIILDNFSTMIAVNKYGIIAETNVFTTYLFNNLNYFGITFHAIIVFCLFLIATEYFRKVKIVFYSFCGLVTLGYVDVVINNFGVIF